MRSSILIAALLVVAVGLWVGSGQFGQGNNLPPAKKPPADLTRATSSPAVRVRLQSAEVRRTEEILQGRTEAYRTVEVSAETDGLIKDLEVDRGSLVEAGQVVARLAKDDRPARLTEAKALLAQRQIEHKAAQKLAKKGFRAETQVAAATAALEAAQARVQLAEIDLGDTNLRAPFDGIVEDRMAEVGDYLQKGDPVARIVDLTPILVIAQVSERAIHDISLGQNGRARLSSGLEVQGRVRFVSPMADPATRTFRVEMEVANDDQSIADGLTAQISLPRSAVEAHRISPAVLSLDDQGVIGVKLVDSDNRVVFLPVAVVANDPSGLWVTGLPHDAVLITVGHEFVKAGQEVRPIDETTLEPFDADVAAARNADAS